MQKNRIFFTYIAFSTFFALGAITSYLIFVPSVSDIRVANTELNRLRGQLDELMLQNNDIGNKRKQAEPSLAVASQYSQHASSFAGAGVPSAPINSDTPHDINSTLYSQIDSLGMNLTKSINSNLNINLADELLSRFKTESVDIGWAPAQENQVRDFFLDNPALADVLPDSIECKTSRCLIQFSLVDLDSGNRISMAVATAIASTPKFSQLSITSGFNYEQAVLQVYIPRHPGTDLLQ